MVRHLDINYVFKHPFEKVTRAYFKKVMKLSLSIGVHALLISLSHFKLNKLIA